MIKIKYSFSYTCFNVVALQQFQIHRNTFALRILIHGRGQVERKQTERERERENDATRETQLLLGALSDQALLCDVDCVSHRERDVGAAVR